MARMIADVVRCGVLAIPTAKVNNKISGHAAVKAIYDDIFENKLTKIDGSIIPLGVEEGHYMVTVHLEKIQHFQKLQKMVR